MEYCEQDMAYLMDNVIVNGPGYTPSQIKCLMLQLLKGLRYLHRKFIVHRDLKLSNLLLTRDGILKIADFGLSRRFGKPLKSMTPRVVTLWYRSPELLLGTKDYSTAIDVWSAGCIFGEFLLSKPMLPGKTELEQYKMIVELLGSPDEHIWPGYSDLPFADVFKTPWVEMDDIERRFPNTTKAGHRLLKRMLAWSPKKRTTAVDAMDSSYFDEFPKGCDPILLPTYPELRNRNQTESGADMETD
jgi:cyclin-dependent kinase 10